MEKKLYDTSELIECYKNRIPVRGYTTILNLIEFPKALELDLVVIYPSKLDYELALKLSTELLRIGKPVPAIDAVIAATALNRKLKLVTKDKHFMVIKEIREDFELLIE